MKKTIYISGPITDLQSGHPREGWQKDFLKAEAKLREMGFNVINPVDIAWEVEESFKWPFGYFGRPCSCNGEERPSRTDYIMACLQRMKAAQESDMLHGVMVIGGEKDALRSTGVCMELMMATLLQLPIYTESEIVGFVPDCGVELCKGDITELLND